MHSNSAPRLAWFRAGCCLLLWGQVNTATLLSAGAAAGLDATRETKTNAPGTGSVPTETHWSLKALARPPIPQLASASPRASNPIDSFVRSTLEKKGLAPGTPADKRTVLRRLYYDLIGLPPTPAAVAAFIADDSTDAYEKVVDFLLSSPRYGERWARHWLDVVHYAETHGHDQDRIRTNAWPYRDYVIDSFNSDKPYPRFVEEQIAGDVLFPEAPAAIPALGFLATGPWDESSLRDIREDTVDREIARYLDRDDIVTTVMQTFVSTTAQCARCHHHKFDPISQEEYYGLQAVFAATDKANRVYDLDPRRHVTRQAWLKKRTAIERKDPSILDEIQQPAFDRELAAYEAELKQRTIAWTPLDPVTFASSNQVTLTKQSDSSLLAQGKRAETDTYTVVSHTDLKSMTAIRLEALTDATLPQQGPGRQDNGNFHLTDFRVLVAPLRDPNARVAVPLQNPSADYNQSGWDISKAIDGDLKTGWGVHPQVGRAHQAVFEFKTDPSFEGGTVISIFLAQNHGDNHVIGRFRLSVTTAPRPVRPWPFPETIAQIIATPRSERSPSQRVELGLYYLSESIGKKLDALPPAREVYAGASDFVPDGGFKPAPGPRPVRLLKRGEIHRPGDLAEPGALRCVGNLAPEFKLTDSRDEGARRAALAKWITDRQNPLTWRSIVNRVWHYHFGRGLVDTPNDFGRLGSLPSHPHLIDWLAVTFRDDLGGSLKKLHRLIVTSGVYRQSSTTPAGTAVLAVDADNRWLWRMNRTRLDAEQLRDSILQITGQLNLQMGGPSVKQFALAPGIHVTPVVDYDKFDVDSAESRRRAIYRFIFRTLPDPFLDTLDCPDPSQLTPARNVSVTALQALALLNNQFMVRQSEHFAARVSGTRVGEPGNDPVTTVFQLALLRPPTDEERRELTAYTRKHGLANLCRLILNSNEFVFVD